MQKDSKTSLAHCLNMASMYGLNSGKQADAKAVRIEILSKKKMSCN